MKSEWKKAILSDFIEFKNGKKRPDTNGIYPVYGGNGILGNSSDSNYKNIVVIGRVGAFCGSVYFEPNNCWISDNAIAAKSLPNSYINYDYYLLKFLQLNKRHIGTSQPLLTQEILNKIEVLLPTLKEQRAIAATLSCLDDKIELNNKINANLEAQAQAIFKSWFVDFEPFQDGEFVDSELGAIPIDFTLQPLYNFAEYINGASFKRDEYAMAGVPIIKIAELKSGITDSTQYCSAEKDTKYYIKNKDLLFSWSGNPNTSIDTFIWCGGEAILNQHIFRVIPNEDTYSFVYCLLRYFKPEFTRIASNKQTTGLGHVTIADLKRVPFVYSQKHIEEFCKIVYPLVDKIYFNMLENNTLIALRDELLTKIMSGKINIIPVSGL